MDPFIGSGQTAIAAIKTKRHYEGYDIDKQYVRLAKNRIRDFMLTYNTQKTFEFTLVRDKRKVKKHYVKHK